MMMEDDEDELEEDDMLMGPSALGMDGGTDTEHEGISMGHIGGISAKQISSKEPSAVKSKKTSSNAKSSSLTRPSSSITNYTT